MSPELLSLDMDQSVGQVEGAVYWVDKVVRLSTDGEEHPEDVYSLGQALVSAKPPPSP